MALEVITYNNVPLQIIATKEISRRHVLSEDKTTYLWTEWLFDIVTQLNPATIGVLLSKIGGPGGIANFPAITDTVIRKLLNVPRRSLVFSQSNDGNIWNVVLNVPNNPANLAGPMIPPGQVDPNAGNIGGSGVGQLTDCQNGPVVEDFSLVRDHAGTTWMVKLRLITRVRECVFTPGSGSIINPIISHRWTRRVDTDEESLSFIETSGEVIFDSAWLLALGTFPDQYRPDLFQPIPPNCQRQNIVVEQQSDGVTYHYSFRDQERHFNTLPAVKIQAFKTTGFSQQGFETAVVGQGIQAINQTAADVIGVIKSGVANPSPLVPLEVTAGIVGVVGVNIARNAFQTFVRQIPKFSTHILVKAWGNRDTPKWTLLAQAMGIASSHFTTFNNAEMIITYELSGKYVELQITNVTGPEQLFLLGKQQAGNIAAAIQSFVDNALEGNVNLQALFGAGNVPSVNQNMQIAYDIMSNTRENDPEAWYHQDENVSRDAFIANLNANDAFFLAFPTGPTSGLNQFYGNMQPPGPDKTVDSNYSRGTLLVNLISQALHDPCKSPPCPPAVYGADGKPIKYPDIRTCGSTAGKPQGVPGADTPAEPGNVGTTLENLINNSGPSDFNQGVAPSPPPLPPLADIISPNP